PADKREQAANARLRKTHEKLLLARKAAHERAAQALTWERAAVRSTLAQQPKFAAYKQELGALLRPAPAGKTRSAKARQQREAALGQFLKRFEDLFRKALTDARVDVARVAAVLSKEFGGGLRFTSTGTGALVAG